MNSDHSMHPNNDITLLSFQESDWDCGAACARTVVQWCHPQHALHATSLDEAKKPAWTIEIFSVLRQFGVDCSMHTINGGGLISPGHCSLDWYASDNPGDEDRIREIFIEAHKDGWPIIEVIGFGVLFFRVMFTLRLLFFCIAILNPN
jgi:hypothetical protein